jgi:hypothetical protein
MQIDIFHSRNAVNGVYVPERPVHEQMHRPPILMPEKKLINIENVLNCVTKIRNFIMP